MLKIRSIYYLIPIRRTMEEVNYLCNHCRKPLSSEEWKVMRDNNQHQLQRIADVLERLLKYTEMSL